MTRYDTPIQLHYPDIELYQDNVIIVHRQLSECQVPGYIATCINFVSHQFTSAEIHRPELPHGKPALLQIRRSAIHFHEHYAVSEIPEEPGELQ